MGDTGPKALGEVLQAYNPSEVITCKAGAAIAKGQIVKLSAAMGVDGVPTVVITAATNDFAYGVALDAAVSGAYLRVLKVGWVKITAGGAIAAGAAIKAGANGKALAAVSTVSIPSGATTVLSSSAQPSMTVESGVACGIAETSASADNDTFMARIDCW